MSIELKNLIIEDLKTFISDQSIERYFSSSEWAELVEITHPPPGDLGVLESYWKKLLSGWSTRNNNPRCNVYEDQVLPLLNHYIDLMVKHFNWDPKELATLKFQLSQVQIEQQQQFLRFVQFQHFQKQERIRALEIESEQTKAEFYGLLELNLFLGQSLAEEEIIRYALDGLMGILDSSYTAILILNQRQAGRTGTFYIYKNGHMRVIDNYVLKGDGFWSNFVKSGVYSNSFDRDTQGRESTAFWPTVLQLFPDICSLTLNRLQSADQLLGLVLAGSIEPKGLSGFRQFINIISTNIASSIQNARLHAHINDMAIRDALTGLYNRRHIEERMAQMFSRCTRHQRELSVIMIDIDRFKRVNDTYGHQAGDVVLKEVSNLIVHRLRASDVVGRFGGEEFLLILDETPRMGATIVAQDLVTRIAEYPINIGRETPLYSTISAGYATYPIDTENMRELVEIADQGLYLAKNSGRNRVCFAGNQRIYEIS